MLRTVKVHGGYVETDDCAINRAFVECEYFAPEHLGTFMDFATAKETIRAEYIRQTSNLHFYANFGCL